MKKLIVLQTVVPDYRKGVFSYLRQELGTNFELYAGSAYFEKTITTDYTITFLKPVTNLYFLNRRLLFQLGMWSIVFKKNVLVLEMNPRIISNWLILLLRRLFFRKTIVWGHAWPRKGAGSKSDKIRHLMRLLGNEIIVYTQTQANGLKKIMPEKKITPAPNALYFKKDMTASSGVEDIKNIIYVGRLSCPKKALFLTESFHKSMDSIPKDSKLIIVGEGEEKEQIESYVARHNLKDRILLKGHISDHKKLESFYATSLFSASPGYVGLSITQSFGFGVPMLISRNEKHSPEIEAAIDGVNSLFFETDDTHSFKEVIVDAFSNKYRWVAKREDICLSCKNTYSTEVMGQTFIDILK